MTAGTAIAAALAAILTIAGAWPAVRSPTRMIFGHEIDGRSADPYVVIVQMAGSSTSGPYAQPLTDRLGWLFARVLPAVAAYNLLILLSFPLTAGATYLLARRLTGLHAAALVGALIFTFMPLRLTHAAYHPHLVQTQWIALYFVALLMLVEHPSWLSALGVALASGALVLSNSYGGLIGAVTTPVALVAFWAVRPADQRRVRTVAIAAAVVAGIAVGGLVTIWLLEPQLLANRTLFAFPIEHISRYRARWWEYVVPPLDNPLTGSWAARIFDGSTDNAPRIEGQVFIGYSVLILAGVGFVGAVMRRRAEPEWRGILAVIAIAAFALLISLGPLSGSCETGSWAVACLLYKAAPMFRVYARFAFVVHLGLAIAAGAGTVILARRSQSGAMIAAALLVVMAAEFAPLPWRAHDVLPTAGHRWLAEHPDAGLIFDCTPDHPSLRQVPWLMSRTVTFASDSATCRDPAIGSRLAWRGYRYMLAWGEARETTEPAANVRPFVTFPDSLIYDIAAGQAGANAARADPGVR